MKKPVRILILEDFPADVKLLRHELENSEIDVTSHHVDTENEYARALAEFKPDIVLSDYMLPNFDGMRALNMLKERNAAIPFIVVTGTVNEEVALQCIKAGAYDYVLKNHIGGIGAAVKRALEKVEIQRQLWQSQKLEVLGRFASDIVHEFNNVLGTIKLCVYLEQNQCIDEVTRTEHLRIMKSQIERAEGITGQLRLFGRKSTPDLAPANLNQLVVEFSPVLRPLLAKVKVSIECRLENDLWTAQVNADLIRQVLLNLALNARDAMPEGGTLTISSTNVEYSKHEVSNHGTGRSGRFVRISVTDTGGGMDEDVRERIFEPFFTTKDPEKGTGLGLSVVYGIIKDHNGWIDVRSKKGAGSTFEIYLPAIDVNPSEGQPR